MEFTIRATGTRGLKMMPLGYLLNLARKEMELFQRESLESEWQVRDSLSREAAVSQSAWLPRLSQAILMWWESAREALWVCITEPRSRVELDFPLIYSPPALCCLKWPLPGTRSQPLNSPWLWWADPPIQALLLRCLWIACMCMCLCVWFNWLIDFCLAWFLTMHLLFGTLIPTKLQVYFC